MSRRREGSPASGPPAIVTPPALGRASPARSRSSVLFPAPFGPTTRWHSPGLTERETPRSARAAPKRRSRPRASRREDTAAGVSGRGEVTRGGVPARAGIYLRPPGLHVEQIGHGGEGQQETELVARVLEHDPLSPGLRVTLDQHERGESGGIDSERRAEIDGQRGPIRQAVQLADHPLAKLHAGVQPQLFGGGDAAGDVGRGGQGILSHARSDLETPPPKNPGAGVSPSAAEPSLARPLALRPRIAPGVLLSGEAFVLDPPPPPDSLTPGPMTNQLDALLSEQRRFPPPAEFAARALGRPELYQKAKADRLRFWEAEARSLDWIAPR